MPYTSCHYALFGVECYRMSLRDTWRHFITVMHAVDATTLERYQPHDKLMGWAGPGLDKNALRDWTKIVLDKMGLPRVTFVIFALDVERPEDVR